MYTFREEQPLDILISSQISIFPPRLHFLPFPYVPPNWKVGHNGHSPRPVFYGSSLFFPRYRSPRVLLRPVIRSAFEILLFYFSPPRFPPVSLCPRRALLVTSFSHAQVVIRATKFFLPLFFFSLVLYSPLMYLVSAFSHPERSPPLFPAVGDENKVIDMFLPGFCPLPRFLYLGTFRSCPLPFNVVRFLRLPSFLHDSHSHDLTSLLHPVFSSRFALGT